MTTKTKKKATRVGGSARLTKPRATASAAGGRERRTPRTVGPDATHLIPRDNVSARGWWMLTDGYRVTIARQKVGEAPTQKITVPRHIFDAFADWYQAGVWKLPRKREGE